MNTAGERIKHFRKDVLKINQQTFADKIKVTKSYISNLETNYRDVTDRTIYDIVREFNVNEEWLRTGEGDIFIDLNRDEAIAAWAGKLISSGEDNNFAKAFTHALTKLDTNEWQAIESFVNKIIESRNDLNSDKEDKD